MPLRKELTDWHPFPLMALGANQHQRHLARFLVILRLHAQLERAAFDDSSLAGV